jgi:hypothetical protein
MANLLWRESGVGTGESHGFRIVQVFLDLLGEGVAVDDDAIEADPPADRLGKEADQSKKTESVWQGLGWPTCSQLVNSQRPPPITT